MSRHTVGLTTKEVIPRVVGDLFVVQIAMLTAVASSVFYQLYAGETVEASELVRVCMHFYLQQLPLSLMFPLVFMLDGFYTHSRTYMARFKLLHVAKGATIATLIYIVTGYLVLRPDSIPRSVIVTFGVLAPLGTVAIRLMKEYLDRLSRAGEPLSETSVVESDSIAAQKVILILGGAGYIGSILTRRLIGCGYRVRILDSFMYGGASLRDLGTTRNCEVVAGDCRNIHDVVAAMSDVESIVHLAAIVGDPACEEDRTGALEINYAATRMIIEIAKGYGVMNLIFASSCSVYGASDLVMNEKSAVAPLSLYARTKLDSEEALLAARSESFHPTILRFATVFGHSYRPRFDLVVNLLTAKAYQEGSITIFNGEQWRPFIHVRDVAESILATLKAPRSVVSGEIFNVGDSRLNFTLKQIAASIQAQFPDTRVEEVENNDKRNYRVSFDKIYGALGFECGYDVVRGIEELRKVFSSGEVKDYGWRHITMFG